MTHPSSASLLDFVENSLSEQDRAAIETHLASPCAPCAADVARLRSALEALTNDDTVAPPEDVLQRAFAAFRRRPAAPPRARTAAVLVFDNYRQASLAAVRGPATRARQLLFTADGLDIDLQITFAGGSATLAGQILGDQQFTAVVQLCRAGEILDGAPADPFGRFVFRPIPPGTYDLVIELDSQDIAIERLDLTDAG